MEIFNSGQTIQLMKTFNPRRSKWGSHIRLLSSAALATNGDILEMGTGYFSTPMLHDIVSSSLSPRMLVSSDTDLGWLFKFVDNSSAFHQMVGVPVYEDGAHCGRFPGGSFPVLGEESLRLVGSVNNLLRSNKDINCHTKF